MRLIEVPGYEANGKPEYEANRMGKGNHCILEIIFVFMIKSSNSVITGIELLTAML